MMPHNVVTLICVGFIALTAFFVIEWQIQNNSYRNRRVQCAIIQTPYGYKGATTYQYYNCMTGVK